MSLKREVKITNEKKTKKGQINHIIVTYWIAMGESSCGGHYGVGVGVGGSLLYSLYYYYKLVLTKRRVEMVNETPRINRPRIRGLGGFKISIFIFIFIFIFYF